MKQFLSIDDVTDPMALVNDALALKKDPFSNQKIGANKVLGLIFFNPSLRTRMSTVKAAYNLGMKVMVLNVSSDSWQLEMEDGTIMDQGKAEHIQEAAAVIGGYCDVLGLRSFPSLTDREKDYSEQVLTNFVKYSGVPIINMESATLHPLQSLADWMTITELKIVEKPKVVLSWAPHISALPQAVPNSFAQWMSKAPVDLVITHPEGMELDEQFTNGTQVEYDQQTALEEADFVYVKNWSSFSHYGQVYRDPSWMLTLEKMKMTNNAKVMHCLPVRRNVVVADDVLDSQHSIVLQQAKNREFSAQAVIQNILQEL